jgi:cyanophycinase
MRRTLLATIAATAAATALLAAAPLASAAKGGGPGYDYYSYGNVGGDVVSTMSGGLLMSGGGIDDPAAMTWLLGRGGNGGVVDVVVLDAYGPDIYGDPFIGWGANSVDAFVFSKREGAYDQKVLDAIGQAEVIWLDGGDQSNYVTLWDGTPLQAAVNARVAQGAAFGGMSAGLAVQGGWVYSAMNGSATSSNVLANPYDKDVTLRGALFSLPFMANTITDTHFAIRDRMGRLLGFLARLEKDLGAKAPRAIAVDEDSSLGVDAKSGDVRLFGAGAGKGAWLIRTDGVTSRTVEPRTALTYGPVSVTRMTSGDTFNLRRWSGQGTETYPVSATSGVLSPAFPY